MLYWTLVFLLVAVVAGFFGFGVIASTSVGIAKALFFFFLVLTILSAIGTALRRSGGKV